MRGARGLGESRDQLAHGRPAPLSSHCAAPMTGLAADPATGASAARRRLRSVCFALPPPTDAPGPAPLFTSTVGPGRARATSSRVHHATRRARDQHGEARCVAACCRSASLCRGPRTFLGRLSSSRCRLDLAGPGPPHHVTSTSRGTRKTGTRASLRRRSWTVCFALPRPTDAPGPGSALHDDG